MNPVKVSSVRCFISAMQKWLPVYHPCVCNSRVVSQSLTTALAYFGGTWLQLYIAPCLSGVEVVKEQNSGAEVEGFSRAQATSFPSQLCTLHAIIAIISHTPAQRSAVLQSSRPVTVKHPPYCVQ